MNDEPELRMIPAWLYVLVVILWIAMAMFICVWPTRAQTTCIPIAYVRVIAELNASIRTSPEVTDDNRNRIGNLTYESGEKAAWEFRNGFYHLCEKSAKNEEQWVSATYNGGRNALLTVRLVSTPTPAPTQRATIGIVTATNTPTRLVTNTPTRTPTPGATATTGNLNEPYYSYADENGNLEIHIVCPDACLLDIYITGGHTR